MAVPDALALLLADARLPVAGHTQSAGLEPGLARGLTDVPAYQRLRLATVTRVEAGTAVAALAALVAGRPLEPVVDAWAARTPSRAMRDTSRAMGKALLRVGRRLWPLPELPDAAPRPVVLGAVAHTCGIQPQPLARVVGYDDVQTVASAALKLLPLDPTAATGWVVDALPQVEELAASVARVTSPEQIPAASAPIVELYAEAHATTTRRLFNA